MIEPCEQKSIMHLFRKYEQEPDHALQVTRLALTLFDKTRGLLHNFSDRERDLLEAGTLLHDIGYAVSAKGHNKLSAKIIRSERPSPYTEEEIEIIANIARYHRGRPPHEKHKHYAALSNSAKELTKQLSAFTRFADALDRSHLSVIKDFDCTFDTYTRTLYIVLKLNSPECSVEISKAKSKKDLLEYEFSVEVIFTTEK